MSKRSQNFEVALKDLDDQVQVMVADQKIGRIETGTQGFVGYVGDQVVVAQAKSTDEALQAILASFNLHH
ncbi:DUF2969 family protein [Lactobacillaceae bacterium L1_55_11]|nr:DUF2969 family protein [Lactobacillaceae bacterium L1_55_11]